MEESKHLSFRTLKDEKRIIKVMNVEEDAISDLDVAWYELTVQINSLENLRAGFEKQIAKFID